MTIRPLIFLALLMISCSKPVFKSRWTKEISPATYAARFETSKGSFDVEVNRSASPKAADRFYQLVKHHYFDADVLFYRVVPKFVAQFGTGDSVKEQKWSGIKVPDEPVLLGNTIGTISYARSGAESRGTQLFINVKDNPRLDTIGFGGVKGFPAFGRVIRGMEVVDSLYNGYGDSSLYKFDLMFNDKVKFILMFPKLDSIRRAYLLKSK